jgi:hypothetical protein
MKAEMSESTRKIAKLVLPLRRREELAAIEAGKAHVAKDLSDHYRILGAELRIDKPSDPRKVPIRTVSVVIVDYGNRRNCQVLVRRNGQVLRVIDLNGAQPGFTTEEVEEAREIGEQDERVARFAKMKGSFVSEFGPERAPNNARQIGLRYAVVAKGRVPRVLARTIIDLSARKLVQFERSLNEPGSRR